MMKLYFYHLLLTESQISTAFIQKENWLYILLCMGVLAFFFSLEWVFGTGGDCVVNSPEPVDNQDPIRVS